MQFEKSFGLRAEISVACNTLYNSGVNSGVGKKAAMNGAMSTRCCRTFFQKDG